MNPYNGYASEIVNDFSAFVQISVYKIDCNPLIPMNLIFELVVDQYDGQVSCGLPQLPLLD